MVSPCAKCLDLILSLMEQYSDAAERYLPGACRPHAPRRAGAAGQGPGKHQRFGKAVRHGAAVLHEAHPCSRGQRIDPDAQARPRADMRHREEAICHGRRPGCPHSAPSGKAAPTGSNSSSPPATKGKIEMIRTFKSGTRPDDIARHQGAPGRHLERLDGPCELRAMVGSGAGQMQGLGNGPSSRRRVRDGDQRERRRFRAASERLLPRHRRWRAHRLHECAGRRMEACRTALHDGDHHAARTIRWAPTTSPT